jgi:hypothetical protein
MHYDYPMHFPQVPFHVIAARGYPFPRAAVFNDQMKTAKLSADSVVVVCPHCDECLPEPQTGSLTWMRCNFDESPMTLHCFHCNKPVTVTHKKRVDFE